MLTGLKDILSIAEKKGFAVPAFNTYNMETVMGIAEAAEELSAPVIIQCYSRLFSSKEGYFVSPIILAAAEKVSVPVCFHLDHGSGSEPVTRALRYGATGIMIDASANEFEKNVKITKNTVDTCAYLGIGVEGELGHVGTVNDEKTDDYTNADEAAEFVRATGVDALAILVGTAHGRYKKAPRLDIDRIRDINKSTGIPLVLHGGSGVPDDQIRATIDAGIKKINFGTDVCYSFLDKVFETSRDKIAIDLFMKDAIESVKQFAAEKIKLLGADNKA